MPACAAADRIPSDGLPGAGYSNKFHWDFCKSKEKCVMKLLGKLVCAGPLLFLLYAAPACAQFEVSPDHFDSVINHAPPKTAVASKRETPRQHLGTQAAASRQSQAPKSQSARTSSSENTQVTSIQRHSHGRKASRSAKASARFQPPQQTAQVAHRPGE